MSKHYRYGGSTASRTLTCPGWAMYCEGTEKDKGSVYANEGTMLHNCCEVLEKDGIGYDELLAQGMEYEDAVLTEESLVNKVIPAMEALDELCDIYQVYSMDTEQLIEITALIGGTIDLSGPGENALIMADYKFGDGEMVYAFENDQLNFYAWAKLKELLKSMSLKMLLTDFPKVILAIIQPSDRREKTLDIWETTIDDILAFGKRFEAAVAIGEASKPGENLHPGHCKYCPRDGHCKAQNEKTMAAFKKLDNLVVRGDKNKLVVKEDYVTLDLKDALLMADELEPIIKAIRAFAAKLLEAGTDPADLGRKLIAKRANRQWRDPEKAAVYLKRKFGAAKAMQSKPISPKQAEDMAKLMNVKLRLDKLVIKESSGTTLVSITDKRPAVLSQKAIGETLSKLEDKTCKD